MEGVWGPDRDQEQGRGQGRDPVGGKHLGPDWRKRAMRSFQLEGVPRRDGCLIGDFNRLRKRPTSEAKVRLRGCYGFFSGADVFGSAIFDFSMGPGFSIGAKPPKGNFFSCTSRRDT